MIAYLKGEITIIEKDYIILECNNIGYKIYFSNNNEIETNKLITIYTYQHFKEDESSLYGFLNNDCKNFFENLISVKGIGVKTAMNILKNKDYKEIINAIINDNIDYLCKLPKVSSKSANQIIIDLKGKLHTQIELEYNDQVLNVIQVLGGLGYSKDKIRSIENKLYNQEFTSEQECLKYAIKLLNNTNE